MDYKSAMGNDARQSVDSNSRTMFSPKLLRARLNARTHELAALAGRSPPFVTQQDYERAKVDVTGETDRDRQNAALDGQR